MINEKDNMLNKKYKSKKNESSYVNTVLLEKL